MAERPPARSRLLRGAAQMYLGRAISAWRYPNPYTHWKGDLEAGVYGHDDGSGNLMALAWDPKHVVAVAFDHESDRSAEAQDVFDETNYDPRRFLTGLPEAHASLLDAAVHAMHTTRGMVMDAGNVTAGAWWIREEPRLAEPWTLARDNGLWTIEPLELDASAAFAVDSDIGFAKWFSLSPDQAALARALAPRLFGGRIMLTAAERTLLARTHDGQASPDGGRSSRDLLRSLGVQSQD